MKGTHALRLNVTWHQLVAIIAIFSQVLWLVSCNGFDKRQLSKKRQHRDCLIGMHTCKYGVCRGRRCICDSKHTGEVCDIMVVASSNYSSGYLTDSQHQLSANTNQGQGACSNNPCLFGGMCLATGTGSYECQCDLGHDPSDDCHVCRYGYFGDKCKQKCGRCLNFCHHKNGCNRCAQGFVSVNGSGSCDKISCLRANKNPTNRAQDPCAPAGKCVGDVCVCSPGWMGPGCKVKVELSRFATCSRRCIAGSCYMSAGNEYCICAPGYHLTGDTCVKKCVDFSLSCVNGKCNAETNTCECKPGYYGGSCDEICPINRYGANCTNTCGKCWHLPCVVNTGNCRFEGHKKCLDGWWGPKCQKINEAYREITGYIPTYARIQVDLSGIYKPSFDLQGTTERESLSKFAAELSELTCKEMKVTCSGKLTNVYNGHGESICLDILMSFNFSEVKVDNFGESVLIQAMWNVAGEVKPPTGYLLLNHTIQIAEIIKPEGSSLSSSSDLGQTLFDNGPYLILFVALFISVLITGWCLLKTCLRPSSVAVAISGPPSRSVIRAQSQSQSFHGK